MMRQRRVSPYEDADQMDKLISDCNGDNDMIDEELQNLNCSSPYDHPYMIDRLISDCNGDSRMIDKVVRNSYPYSPSYDG